MKISKVLPFILVVIWFEFRVTGTAITGQSYDETFVTDENGEIYIENLRIGTYTVTELNVAERYIAPADVTVSVEAGKTVEVQKVLHESHQIQMLPKAILHLKLLIIASLLITLPVRKG